MLAINKKNFSIVIPVYNEEANIINLYNEILRSISDEYLYEICIINDGSTDNSFKLLKNLKKHNIKIINNNKNFGQSYSIFVGVKYAKYNTIVTLDGDGQNPPSEIIKLLKVFSLNKEEVLVGGIRNKRNDSIQKVYASKIANSFRSFILKDNCKDTGCGLKVFSKEQFLKIDYFNGYHRFFPALFKSVGVKCIFVNVSHRSRKFGNSKYNNIKRLLKGLIDIIRVKYIMIKNNV